MGRVAIEVAITNEGDQVLSEAGHLPADQVRRATIEGLVDTGAAMLVLPESVVRQLGLPKTGVTGVRYADHRTATRDIVGRVRVKLQGREDVFTAVVEPGRTTALIGAIVLEALDLLVDCKTQTLQPRDPNQIITEIE
jgi:clan AA aspartic protease